MRDSRRSTLQALAASVLAIGLGGLRLEDAAAQCKSEGKKCTKGKQCCSGKCKGKKGKKKCRCRALREPCTGTLGSAGNTCCGALFCGATACESEKRCCQPIGETCSSPCDCCSQDAQCVGGECCLGEGGLCAFVGDSACCSGLFCDPASGNTCQPV